MLKCLIHALLLLCLGALLSTAATPVIIVSIDTLRADHLSAYGYRVATPNIDSFTSHGLVFRNISSQIPLTLPSHNSLLTSSYPFENSIEENAEPVPRDAVTLASVLQARGYRTAAFIGSVFLESEMGLNRGFDVYDSPFHFAALSPLSGSMFLGDNQRNLVMRERRDAALVLRSARQWLTANQGATAFVFIHLFDLHKPYQLAGYDAEIQHVDHLLGAFKKYLVETGWWDRSLILLLADHGESLGEHGESSHGYFIYQSTLWVPLLIHWPADTAPPAPDMAQEPAGLMDVAPTILDLLHLPRPSSFAGMSLFNGSRPVFAESVHAHDAFGWAPLRSLRLGDFKYIEAPRPELYNLRIDPNEQTNLVRQDPVRAQNLRRTLLKLLADHAPRVAQPTIDPRFTPGLTSLGYLAPGPKTKLSGPQPDPKDRLAEFHLYERAELALSERRLNDAVALLRQLLATDPRNTLARRDLGSALLDRGLATEARQCFLEVLVSAPGDYVSHFLLGMTAKRLHLILEARQNFEAACHIAPASVECRRELDALPPR